MIILILLLFFRGDVIRVSCHLILNGSLYFGQVQSVESRLGEPLLQKTVDFSKFTEQLMEAVSKKK